METDNRQGPSILICDTDADFIDNCKLVMSAWRYRAHSINDCTKVLDILTQGEIDLIIIDMHFFDTSSLLMIRLLKSFHLTRDIPLITLSFDTSQEEKAKKAGADGFVTRPVKWQEMKAMIDTVIKRERQSSAR